jgi:DNA polymerase III epsilon subunit
MPKNLDEIEFTIFDTETTGLEPESGDRIVEIAGIRFKGEEKIATFQTLVNPHRQISPAAFEVNKITSDMLKDAPSIETVMPKFLDFAKDSYLCSYNAGFDLEFLNNELKLTQKNLLEETVVIDILKMAKRLMPGLERYALWFVAERLGLESTQEHRALSDVELTLRVFKRLKANLRTKGIFDFQNFSSLFGLNSKFLKDINSQKIAKIQEAMGLGVKLKIKYLSSSNATVSEREVIPKEIKQENSRFYLVGYCCLRNEERTFRIDSILHLEII